MRSFQKGLSMLFILAMILSLVFAIPAAADEPALSPDSYDVIFLSDLHNGVGGYTGLEQMLAEVKAEGQNPRVLSHGGDYVEDGQGGEVDWQTRVFDVISGMESAAFPEAEQAYTMGNHDWETGTFGGRTDKAAAFEEIFKFPRCGVAYADGELEIYTIGAQGVTGAGGGGEAFIDADIKAFDQYLDSMKNSGKVIFLQTHWPAHSSYNFKQRVVTNSDKLIDILNKYGDDMDLVWMWGHNHYEDSMRYTILQPGDEILYAADTSGSSWGNPRNPKYKTIKFTYANVGCMNDMWWRHSDQNDTDAAGNYRGPAACVSVAVDNTITFTYNRIKQDDGGEWVFSHDANLWIYNHSVFMEHPANVTVDRLRIAMNSIGEIQYGIDCVITGKVRSHSNLTSVTGEIFPAQDQVDDTGASYEPIQAYTAFPEGQKLELADSEINDNLDFSSLAPGSYILKITAKSGGRTVTQSVGFTVSPPPKPKIKLTKFSNNKTPYGSDPNLTGTVTSTGAKLTRVTGEILSGTTGIQTYTEYPNDETLTLKTSEINDHLDFSILDPGAYTLVITAENAGGEATGSFNFTVTPPAKPGITFKNFDKIKIPYGSDPNITGTVTSAVAKLTGVTGEILSGTTVIQTHAECPDGKTLSFESSEINDVLDFSMLNPGSYKLKITAANIGGTTTKTVSFTIKNPPLPVIATDSIGSVPYGSDHIVSGTVTSTDADLNSVTAEILSGKTVMQTCAVSPNGRTFDLGSGEVNDVLDFSLLDPGSYKLKITAANIGGTTTKTISVTIQKPPLPSIVSDGIGTVPCESDHTITGTVTSTDADITSVTAQILSGKTVKQKHTEYPNARTFDLAGSEINDVLDFSTLSPGSYTLKITAVNIGGTTTISVSFTVPKPELPTIELTDIVTVAYESDYDLAGQITSAANLSSVKVQILSGSTVKQTCTIYPNVRTLDLGSTEINDTLVFSSLAPGSYTLKISAVNAGGTKTISDGFTVPKPEKPTISVEEIGEIPYGSAYVIPGDVISDASLTSVKVEILSGSTSKQSYTVKPNVRAFDLRSIEPTSKFDFAKLKSGSYKLKITAVNAGGTTSVTINFKIV